MNDQENDDWKDGVVKRSKELTLFTCLFMQAFFIYF